MIIVQPAPPACGTQDPACGKQDPACGEQNGDEALSQRLRAALERQPWFSDGAAQVFVVDGVVTIAGFLADDAFGQALCATVRSVAGEHNVRNEMIRVDAVSGCGLAIG